MYHSLRGVRLLLLCCSSYVSRPHARLPKGRTYCRPHALCRKSDSILMTSRNHHRQGQS